MKTILVPTDFSEASLNAALYAIGFAKQVDAKKIIFYHTYTIPIHLPIEPLTADVDIVEIDSLKNAAQQGLQYFEKHIKQICPTSIEIELLANYGFISDDIKLVCKDLNVDIIIMGISKGGIFSENIIGNDAIIIARNALVPVVVVPNEKTYKSISSILLVSDLKDIETITPVETILSILSETKAKLTVLHVVDEINHAHYKDALAREKIKGMFMNYNPELYFVAEGDFVSSINNFAETNKADLVICIPKKHSLLQSIFVKSHTKDLAYHSEIPILAVHS